MKAAERDSLIALLKSLDRATLDEVTAGLTSREKAAVSLRFGLNLVPRLNHQQIAKKFGVPIARVNAIDRKFRRALESWDDGLARLGECIVCFQEIEEMLSLCIIAILSRDRTLGEIITSELSFRAKIKVYLAFV